MKISLFLFGRMRVRVGDEIIDSFPTQRAALLLARLARAPNKGILRDTLAGDLWPGDDLENARVKFRQELSRLRRTLGPAAAIIQADRTFVRLDPDSVMVDVDDFLHLIKSAEAAAHPRDAFDRWQRAAEIASSPFCMGVRDPWTVAERRHLADQIPSSEFANLPDENGRLVGREFEVRFISDLLMNRRSDDSFVHVVAPSGFGKSVLLAEVARRLASHPLAVLDNPSPACVRGHLLASPGVPLVCAGVQPLGIPGERIVRLHALPVPRSGPTDNLSAFPSVRLYLDSANGHGAPSTNDLNGVANLVTHLEGWPLPILLAARRAAVYPPDDLLARESDLVGLLADRRPVEPDRHRSFEAAMRWNISRIPASASDFLAQFARLDSPFSADVVEDRWSAPGIEALEVLLDFGLVERSSAGFRVPRPVQAFARQKDLN